MSEQMEYIEAYFQKKLSETERKEFEERCIQDREFADDVAFYISSMEVAREKLLEQKKREWSVYNDKESMGSATGSVVRMNFRRILPYAAAAFLILAVIGYSLFSTDSPEKLANKYVQEQYTDLSHSMSSAKDSLESGISAYNNKDYKLAIQFFQNVYNSHPEKTDAKKYLGLSYLQMKDFDKALTHFDELAKTKAYSNPGLFLKAVTLLQRNRPGDEQNAKQLLQQVDSQALEGSKEAHKWLEKWPKR